MLGPAICGGDAVTRSTLTAFLLLLAVSMPEANLLTALTARRETLP